MRQRTFVPDGPGALEGRAAPSAGAPAHLSGLALDRTVARIKGDFQEFALSGQLARLRTQLSQAVRAVPFGRADGLGGQVNAAIQQMQSDLASGGSSRPVTAAYDAIIADIGSIVRAHIADGTIAFTPY